MISRRGRGEEDALDGATDVDGREADVEPDEDEDEDEAEDEDEVLRG
jgi:hypothetical protein